LRAKEEEEYSGESGQTVFSRKEWGRRGIVLERESEGW
jgi:hypothetical protein